MPEVLCTKRRRGTASLNRRTTKVAPKEYWPGVGEEELGFHDRNRNSRSTKSTKQNPNNDSLKLYNDFGQTSFEDNSSDTKSGKHLKRDEDDEQRSIEVGTPKKKAQRRNQMLETKGMSTNSERTVRRRRKKNHHQKQQTAQQPVPENPRAVSNNIVPGPLQPLSKSGQMEPFSRHPLSNSSKTVRRPKRMLLDLLPHNNFGLTERTISRRRKRRQPTHLESAPELLLPQTPRPQQPEPILSTLTSPNLDTDKRSIRDEAESVTSPSWQSRSRGRKGRSKRMLTDLFPYNAFGLKDTKVDVALRRTRRHVELQRQPRQQ